MMKRITKTTETYINFRPGADDVGVNQGVDLYVTYMRNGEMLWFSQQLRIDVYPHDEPPQKLFEHLEIKINDIHMEGKAGDPNLAILQDLKQQSASTFELLGNLKQSEELWTAIDLFEAINPESPESFTRTGSGELEIPPVPGPCNRLTLEGPDGLLVQLYGGAIDLGKSRTRCDLVTRVLPGPGEAPWSTAELKQRNRHLSRMHCRIGVNAARAWIRDGKRIDEANWESSLNGTFLDGVQLPATRFDLPVGMEVELALARLTGDNFSLRFTVHALKCSDFRERVPPKIAAAVPGENVAGIVIRRLDNIPECYVVLNHWMPLSAVVENGPEDWFLCREHSAFGLTDGQQWLWLSEPIQLPPASGLGRVRAAPEQYLG